ncbi:MAG: LPS-assembly protein LptD, partial [Planktomarina sp.]
QIYFEHAQLRFFGIPILYLPRVRLPDPTLDRARGFLIPEFKNNTRLGFGVKTPYFIPLGKHKDLTLAPYLTSKTTTVELRYRQATRNGGFEFEGAVSRDDLLPGETRGYLFGSGAFDLARDYKLTFDVQAVTDLTYFDDYRYSDKDRLRSRIEVSRVRRNKNVELRLSAYHSLRPADINSQLPNIVVEGVMERRVPLSSKLGEFGYQVSFLGSRRSSDTNIVGLDVARLSAQANWFGTYTIASGIILDGYAEAGVDGYFVRQDTNFPDPVFNSTVTASATLRWPWMRKGAGGGVSVIEPIFQLVHTEGTGDPIPNQDSTRVDFDFGNMFASNRAPGHDLTEFGTRLNVGLRGHHSMTNGSELAWSFGRVFRGSNPNVFSTSSGLAGTHSDWLIEAGYKSANGLEILNRNIIANTGGVRKSETRVALDSERNTIAATHTWLEADVAEARPIAVSELSFTGSRAVTDNWTVSTGLRYDFRTETLTEAELGAQYENECIDVNFSASRRFTGVASTDFGLKVSLRGFGTGAVDEKKTHKCGG